VPGIETLELLPCWTFFTYYSAPPCSLGSRSMRVPVTGCEEAAMIEPIIGLVVALALSVYLVVTLLRPEWF